MKRLAAVALLVVGMVVPGWGQRGGGRGGGGAQAGVGRGAGVSRGGFSTGSQFHYSGGGTIGRGGFAGSVPGGASGFRPGYPRRPGYPVRRNVYVRTVYLGYGVVPYSYAIPYVYGPGYYDPDFYGDGGAGYAAPAQSYSQGYSGNDAGGYGAAAMEQGAAPENESYRQAYLALRQPPPADAEAVTLIYKDGRPAEEIHNYVLTRTTLFVRDERPREVAVADLDLDATMKANRAAGVDFELPGARR